MKKTAVVLLICMFVAGFAVNASAKTLFGMFRGEKTSKVVAQSVLLDGESYQYAFANPDKIPWDKFNRIYIAYACVDQNGNLAEGNVNGDVNEWENRLNNVVAQCRVHNPAAEIILVSEHADSPEGCQRYFNAAADPANFAHTVFRLLQTYDLDGFDLCWQNKRKIDSYSEQVKALLDALYTKFDHGALSPRGKKYLLTYTVWPGSQSPELVASTARYVNQINIMSYGTAPKYDLDYYSKAYREAGFPYEKMIGGLESEISFDDFAAGYCDNKSSLATKYAIAKERNMAGMFAWRMDNDYRTADGVTESGAPQFRITNLLWEAMVD